MVEFGEEVIPIEGYSILNTIMRNISENIDLEKLDDSTHLLDILIGCENVLDSLDIYVYKNWFLGEVVRGPIVRRHWVTFDLRYPHTKMPDPRAALRLLKQGVQVEFNRASEVSRKDDEDYMEQEEEPEEADWIVTITVPRRLLDSSEEAEYEIYDDEINPDDVSAAKDIGLDNESPYQQDEQNPMDQGMNQEMEMPAEGPPVNAPPR